MSAQTVSPLYPSFTITKPGVLPDESSVTVIELSVSSVHPPVSSGLRASEKEG